jgi:hypothetical protein
VTETFVDSFEDEAAGNIVGSIVPLAKAEFQTAILVAGG